MAELGSEKADGSSSQVLKIASLISARSVKPVLVAVSGSSCSGKSFFAEQLQSALVRQYDVASSIIHLDDYFKDSRRNNLPTDESGRFIFDLPDSFRYFEFFQHVTSLLGGCNIRSPRYDKKTNWIVSESGELIEASPVIIAEGLYTIHFLRANFSSICVYLEASQDVRLKRRQDRDAPLFSVSREKVRTFFLSRVEPFCDEVAKQKQWADFVIQT